MNCPPSLPIPPRSPKPIFLILGILFLVGAPLCFIGAGAYSYAQPRLFSAATGFTLLFPGVDAPRLQDAFEKAKQQYPSRMGEPLTARVKLQQSGTPDQYRITAIDKSPLVTSTVANTLTLLVGDTLRDASKEDGSRVKIFEKADMPYAPSFPNVRQIMAVGIAAAVFCGAAGVVFFIIAFARRTSGGTTT